MKNVLVYIHNNPVHHGFCQLIDEYPWSSYPNYLSNKSTKSSHDVIKLFDNLGSLKCVNEEKVSTERNLNWDIELS